jgi:hypothetical protein
MDKLIKTLEFPTDIIEENYVAARIYERAGQPYAVLAYPDRSMDEETIIRLEMLAIGLYNMEKNK